MNSELNVAYIGPVSFPTGWASTKRRRYMVDYMNEQQISVHVLCTNGQNKKFKNASQGVYGNADYRDISELLNVGDIFRYINEGKACLKKWFAKDKKNILIFHTLLYFYELPFFLYAKKLGYKIVFDQVETSYQIAVKHSYASKLRIKLHETVSRYGYRRCDGSFIISEALKKQNQEKYPNMPLCILPNSTPIIRTTEKTSFSKVPAILYSGSFAPKDGVRYLIDAFEKVRDMGYPCKLIMTGVGRPEDMKILDRVRNRQDVDYRGFVSDDELSSILQSCDILTMTRTNSIFANYGFPFKLSEYLATANPVIASKVSDVGRILTHKENAYLVSPENTGEIAEGLIYYLENPAIALDIGQQGFKKMKKVFSVDAVGKIFVDFLTKI